MRRLDWQLVHPDGDGNLDEPLQMLRVIRRLATNAAREDISHDDLEFLAGAEDTYYEETLAHCDAVQAPLIEEHPDWEPRIIDEYAEGSSDLELDDYLDMRRRDPDCAHCPYVSPYSLYPRDPCEFSAGALEEILTEAELITRLALPMKPPEMHSLASELESAHQRGAWRPFPGLNSEDYLEKASSFLRLWAAQGFGVLPTDTDHVLGLGLEVTNDTPSDGSTTLH